MRFEVEVDDGANLSLLHKAREAFNAAHPESPAQDMPEYVQRLTAEAVSNALAALGEPLTLPAALTRIAELEAQNATLSQAEAAAGVKAAPAA